MPNLNIEALSELLKSTLSEDDLERFVYSSTGDSLYDDYVGRGNALGKTIFHLLVELEKKGTTRLFLSEVYRRRPNRKDVRTTLALHYPEIIDLADQSAPTFELQEKGASGPNVPEGVFAPGLQRNIKPHL